MQTPSHSRTRHGRRARRSGRYSISFLTLMVCAAALMLWAAAARLSVLINDNQTADAPDSVASTDQKDTVLQSPSVDSTPPLATPLIPEPVETESGEDEEPATEPGQTVPMQAAELPWNLTLVNWEHPLPEDYSAPELVQLRNNQAIDARAYPDLQNMMDAARAEGLSPLICSSFRTYEDQEQLYQDQVELELRRGYQEGEAEEQAAFWVARPGTSEHEMGLAVDIVDTNYQILDQRQENTAVQRWLMEHCWEYGFILRYPTDKSAITHIGYEPWHYRYVGKESAKAIIESGLCLEEYLGGLGIGNGSTEKGTGNER